MRILLLVAAGFLLAGCYESRVMLLDPAAARQPVKTAMDWKYTNDAGTFHARLTPRRDGRYDYQESEVDQDGSEGDPERHVALLNFLDRVSGADIYIVGMWNGNDHAYMYGLAVVRPDINWRVVFPNCDFFTSRGGWQEADLMAAQKAFARRPNGEAGCFFTSTASLKNAMTYVVNTPGFWTRLNAG